MKTNIFAVVSFLVVSTVCSAQSEFLERQKEKAKNKVSNRIENKIDEGMDKTLDKTEEGIESSVKKDKKKNQKKEDKNSTAIDGSADKSENNSSSESTSTDQTVDTPPAAQRKELQVYSKFDFISGERIIGYDDFSTTEIGDFPVNWNTNSSGEVVKIEGQETKFLKLGQEGIYFPEDVQEWSDNVTIEFDMITSSDFSPNGRGLRVFLLEKQAIPTQFNPDWDTHAMFSADIHPYNDESGHCAYYVYDPSGNLTIENGLSINAQIGEVIHVSIWRQKNRVRLYLNETKVIDLPRALYPDVDYDLYFANYVWEGALYIGNLRIAEGAPDTRNKLITEGKLVSRGILFNVNSDKIKPESYGVLKDISKVLSDNPDVHVLIVGHTDSDGNEASNLELSKRRAAAVKKMLTTEFGIAADRLSTDGKGENEPTDQNTSAEGKANNRRVEFIKQ